MRLGLQVVVIALALGRALPLQAQQAQAPSAPSVSELPPVIEGPLAAQLTQHITRGPGTMGMPGAIVEPGREVASTVRLYPLPVAVEAVVPAVRGHRYFIANNRMALVNPESQRIVSIVPIE